MVVLVGLRALASLIVLLCSCLLAAHAADAGDATILTNEIARAQNQSLLWGPYRPNLYFGVRPRIPKSLKAGLMWARVDDYESVQNNFRHTCEQHEGMAGYGWDEYDVRTGGIQTIKDAGNLLDVTTSFVKIPGGIHGGSWAVRVKGVPRAGAAPDSKFTVVFYASLEGLGSVGVSGAIDPLGFEGDVTLEGESEGLGKYKMVVTKGTGKHPAQRHISYDEKPLDRTIVHSLAVPEEYIWQAKSVMFSEIKKEVDRYLATYGQMNPPPPEQVYTMSNMVGPGNFHLVQKVFEGAFEFDVLFTSASASEEVTSQTLTDGIQKLDKSFTERFKEVFKLKAPFDQPQYLGFAKSMFSNLFGGIGYFYGDSVVDRSYASEYDEENEGFWEETEQARALKREKLEGPSELFTSIPSRPFFPRGFLWDEGFHLIPIVDWDMDVALEIVRSWFHLMDQDGWIGREQILGEEARSKVPPEFQVQYPHYANPPTLFFILETFIDRLSAANGTGPAAEPMIGAHTPEIQTAHVDNPEVAQQYLRELYPLLQRQFAWFRRTQSGDLKSYDRDAFSSREAYRWRGRTVQHILTSGLDDYPRAAVPHPGELHVDLISWMGMMSRSLKRIASFLEEEDDARSYAKIENAIARNVDDLHWSEKEGMYCDATIDDFEESVHVCHKGYISLFPFLLGLLPYDSPKLGKVLDLMADPEHLWSEFGLRSLSKSDPLYGTAENYWRGPVWVNVNYLAVRELCRLAASPTSPYAKKAKDLYERLRVNLVNTVYNSWKDTGFAWEQYSPETGKGQRTQHFTGWTSLVVKIMTMDTEPGKGGAAGRHDEL